jgi:hypothetical protein
MKKSSLIFFLLVSFSAQALDSGWDVKFCFTNKDKVDLHCYKQRDDLYSFEFFLDTQHENYHFYTRRPVGLDACLLKKKKIQRIILEEKYCVFGEKILDSEKRISVTLDRVEGKNQFWSYFEKH